MLYICIPAYNEAPTIGVLLWRIRSVFQEYAREYELVVYDDGSTDATAEVLEPYTRVLPLTVLAGGARRGYAAAIDALCRHVAAHTRYPRRDAMIVLQGDFTDRPEHIPELVKRFEGGADIVVAERGTPAADPLPVRRLRMTAPWVLRPFVRLDGVTDVTSGYRLVRISLLRDLLRERGDRPLVSSDGWGANAELLLALAPFARRIEAMPVESRFDVRPRPTRIRPLADALALARFAWRARGSRGVVPGARASGPARDEPRPLTAAAPLAAVAESGRAEAAPVAAPDRERTRTKRRRPERPERPERASELAEPAAADQATTGHPVGDRPPRTRRRAESPRPESEPLVLDVVGAENTDAAMPGADGDATPERRRRKRSRRTGEGRARPATDDGAATDGDAPSTSPVQAGEPGDGTEAGGEADATAGPDAGPPRTGKRRRRSRGRRASTGGTVDGAAAPEGGDYAAAAPDGGDALGDPGDGAQARAGGDSAEGSGAPDLAPGEHGAARTARRSRRGKRRGRRGGSASEPGGDAGGAASESGVDAGGDARGHGDVERDRGGDAGEQ